MKSKGDWSVNEMKRGFSLIEMLVVIGIILTLMGVSVGAYSRMTKRAQRVRGQELVSNVATALNSIFMRTGKWPNALRTEAGSGAGKLNERASVCLGRGEHPAMSLTVVPKDDNGVTKYELGGNDRFGIVSPWAQDVIRRLEGGGTGTRVPSGGTIDDHILRYALDLDGDGFVDVSLGEETVKVRGNVAVWCAGQDGVLEKTFSKGLRKDDIYSWNKGQVTK